MTLPGAPHAVVDGSGQPAFRRFAGQATSFNWGALAPPYRRSALWRRFHHKRWHYAALACDDVFCAAAIVDLGWSSTAFAYVFERRERKVVAAFSQHGVPFVSAGLAPHIGEQSRFRGLSHRILLGAARRGGHALELRCGKVEIDAQFGGPGPLLLAVGPVERGSVHATQKSPGMALTGEVHIGARRFSLDGGVASIDYSNGLLARETDWRCACAHPSKLDESGDKTTGQRHRGSPFTLVKEVPSGAGPCAISNLRCRTSLHLFLRADGTVNKEQQQARSQL